MSKKYGWEQYLAIESDFVIAKKYLSFDRQLNLDADSAFLHNEIVLLGSKVEVAMKELIKIVSDGRVSVGSMLEYKTLLLVMVPDIESYYVSLTGTDMPPLRPFENWSNKKLSWWSAYSEIKHGSTSRVPKLVHGLMLLAALAILLHLIHIINEKKRNGSFAEYDLSELPKLFTLGFEGAWIVNSTRPFTFGYDVSNYNLCSNNEAIQEVI